MNASIARYLALALLAGASTGMTADTSLVEAPADHVTRSSSGFAAEREADGRVGPAALQELKLSADEVVRQAKPSSGIRSHFFLDEAWIYEASVELFDDFDGDGYYTYMRVRLDADTIYNRHHVYVVLLLSADGVYWEDLHITDDFLIRGQSPHDAYEIDVELVSGYPRGLYDLMIELYDSDTGLLLDEFGPAQSSAFSLLPLEDIHSDSVPRVTHSRGRGGAGTTSWILLIVMGALALARSRLTSIAPQPRRRAKAG